MWIAWFIARFPRRDSRQIFSPSPEERSTGAVPL
jgi:hypothetical protein